MKLETLTMLTSIVKSEIERLGGDWFELAYGEVPQKVWKAPPLILEGSLYGLDNRDLMQVSTALSLDEFSDIYETFLYACQAGELMYLPALCPLLRIKTSQGKRLFPRADESNLYNFVPSLATLAYYNFEGEIVEHDYDRFSVRVGDLMFGSGAETIYSNTPDTVYNRGPKPKFARPHISLGRRRELDRTELSDRLGNILNSIYRNSEGYKELEQAMTYIICSELDEARELWGLGRTTSRLHYSNLLETLNIAKDFRDYKQPLEFLQGLLGAEIIAKTQFNKMFGTSKKVTDERLQHYDLMLEQLSETIKKEREQQCY